MTDAINAPVRRGRRAEVHTSDMDLGTSPPIDFESTGPLERGETIVPIDKPIENDYLAALKFAEDPVTILITQGSEEFAPWSVPLWVNGKGAEVLMRGSWVELGYLPVGHEVVTRRKYVEVLARMRPDSIKTEVIERVNEDPLNRINRSTRLQNQFSVIEDKNPRGREWLKQLMAGR